MWHSPRAGTLAGAQPPEAFDPLISSSPAVHDVLLLRPDAEGHRGWPRRRQLDHRQTGFTGEELIARVYEIYLQRTLPYTLKTCRSIAVPGSWQGCTTSMSDRSCPACTRRFCIAARHPTSPLGSSPPIRETARDPAVSRVQPRLSGCRDRKRAQTTIVAGKLSRRDPKAARRGRQPWGSATCLGGTPHLAAGRVTDYAPRFS